MVKQNKCVKCGYKWYPPVLQIEQSKKCPECQSRKWNDVGDK